LEAAYNDRSGITSKFNLNLLARVNRDLGGKFNLRNFFHHAVYNKKKSRIEMYIISKFNQDVYIRAIDHTISFKKNEMIHTENSYKYSIKQIRQLAEDSGFLVKKNYTDEKKWFDLVLLLPI
jgi:L-histidine N-alpha-methyltransferase